ncbi:MAG: hypothetical protein Q7J20_03435, partial [Candidatus Nitrotoga sp.]|nr:hypothetical protein [Candidatus Nitrotoga sp.]
QWLYLRKFFPTDAAGVFLLSHPYSFRDIPQIVNTLLVIFTIFLIFMGLASKNNYSSRFLNRMILASAHSKFLRILSWSISRFCFKK